MCQRIWTHSSSVCAGLQVKCKVGDVVSKGQVVVVLEAMKMEYPVTATGAGQVHAFMPSFTLRVTGSQDSIKRACSIGQ